MSTSERLTRLLIERYKLDPARLTPEQPLTALGIDSLGMVEMLFFIEEEFEVRLPPEGMTLGTLGEAARYLDTLLTAQRPAAAGDAGSAPSAATVPPRDSEA